MLAGSHGAFTEHGILATVLSGVDGAVITTIKEEKPASGFASTITAFDFDGDGLREIIVGAPDDGAGAVHVFSGKTHKLLRTVRGVDQGERFGAFLELIDDGKGGLLVSAPNARSIANPLARGRVSLLNGPELATQRTFAAGGANETFGFCASALGDVDGDGVRDFAFTVLRVGEDSWARSLVRVISGANDKLLYETKSLLDSNSQARDFGRRIAALDDWDGDGIGDIAFGAPFAFWGGALSGMVAVYSGHTGRQISLQTWNSEKLEFDYGMSLTLLADADGDGKRDLLVGAPDSLRGGGVELLSSIRAVVDGKEAPTEGNSDSSRWRTVLRQLEFNNLKLAAAAATKR